MTKNTKSDNEIIIDEANAGQRFDKFLIRRFPLGGKGFVYKMLRKKRVKLNGKRAEGNEMLCAGDMITLYISPETQEGLRLRDKPAITKTKHKINILFEDENVIIVDKPANCLTHPDLTDSLAAHVGETEFKPVAVNRLDRNTTGIVIIAKTLHAAQALNHAIKERQVEKYYLALAKGVLKQPLVLRGKMEKDRDKNKTSIGDTGKDVLTEVYPLGTDGKVTLAEIRLHTGRSHQIRAHLQSIGHPIVGDVKYGGEIASQKAVYPADQARSPTFSKPAITAEHPVKQQLLHAYKIMLNGLPSKFEYLNGKTFISKPKGILGEYYGTVKP